MTSEVIEQGGIINQYHLVKDFFLQICDLPENFLFMFLFRLIFVLSESYGVIPIL